MKALLLTAAALFLTGSSAALALTIEEEVTPEYVRTHAKEISVKVAEGKDGLLAFAVVLTLEEPRYVVAHLTVRDGDKTVATSDTPAFTRNARNTFYFSVVREFVAASEYSLGVSGFAAAGDEAVPIVGTRIYRLRLGQFVPADLLRAPNGK